VLTDPMLTGISFVDAHGALRAGQMVGLHSLPGGCHIGYVFYHTVLPPGVAPGYTDHRMLAVIDWCLTVQNNVVKGCQP
jgi:hypothetical protein